LEEKHYKVAKRREELEAKNKERNDISSNREIELLKQDIADAQRQLNQIRQRVQKTR